MPKATGCSRMEEPISYEGGIALVALSVREWDRQVLSRLASERRWILHFAQTSDEAWRILNECRAPIFLCDREMDGEDWRSVIRRMVSAPHLVCAILISNVADDYLWNEVIRRGGHDVMASPLREEDVLRAIRLAWLYWNTRLGNEPLPHGVKN